MAAHPGKGTEVGAGTGSAARADIPSGRLARAVWLKNQWICNSPALHAESRAYRTFAYPNGAVQWLVHGRLTGG